MGAIFIGENVDQPKTEKDKVLGQMPGPAQKCKAIIFFGKNSSTLCTDSLIFEIAHSGSFTRGALSRSKFNNIGQSYVCKYFGSLHL